MNETSGRLRVAIFVSGGILSPTEAYATGELGHMTSEDPFKNGAYYCFRRQGKPKLIYRI